MSSYGSMVSRGVDSETLLPLCLCRLANYQYAKKDVIQRSKIIGHEKVLPGLTDYYLLVKN